VAFGQCVGEFAGLLLDMKALLADVDGVEGSPKLGHPQADPGFCGAQGDPLPDADVSGCLAVEKRKDDGSALLEGQMSDGLAQTGAGVGVGGHFVRSLRLGVGLEHQNVQVNGPGSAAAQGVDGQVSGYGVKPGDD
jgi:hypothetical protein